MLLKNSNINNIFDTIYETNAWGNGSGSGSKESLNVEYVSFLQDFLKVIISQQSSVLTQEKMLCQMKFWQVLELGKKLLKF